MVQYHRLGDSDLRVSELCLGTMTYGQQNTRAEAAEQLDLAIAHGINFIDMAEMYPVPAHAETQGRTEEFVGAWLASQQRDRVILATKVTGPNPEMPWIRGRDRKLNQANIIQAVEASLQRLGTDYIDLYQIHWPDRYVPLFGGPDYDPQHERPTVAIADQLLVFAELIEAGKIRYLGLSNETPWGVSEFRRLAEQLNLPQGISIQNAYNLTNRVFELHLAETCYHHQMGLLAYSPLAFGHLTGKYQQGLQTSGRITKFPDFGQRYRKPNFTAAVQAYVELANHYQISPAQMSLAFVRSRWFVTSTIIGATTPEQLTENLDSLNLTLSADLLQGIEQIHRQYPNPVP